MKAFLFSEKGMWRP